VRVLFFIFSFSLFVSCQKSSERDFLQVTNGAIKGGELVSSDHPYYSNIVKVFEGNSFCSGVLISSDIVLTAAHCLPKDYFHFRQSGIIDGYDIPKVIVRVEHANGIIRDYVTVDIIAHEYYSPEVWDVNEIAYDMALLKLEQKVLDVNPIDVLLDDVRSGPTEMMTMGYGHFTAALNVGLRNDGHLRSLSLKNKSTNEIFLTFFDNEQAPCIGDSGGPVLMKIDDKFFVAGVLSFALPHKAMTDEQRLIFAGPSGQEANWDELYAAFPDYDECAGGEFYYTSTKALSDFIKYYLPRLKKDAN
jgi:secreted trypsin-like serine protease